MFGTILRKARTFKGTNLKMKKYILLLAAGAMLLANPAEAKKAYGKGFKVTSVQTTEQLMSQLDSSPSLSNVVVKGEISQVCQAEGCWMN